MRVPRYFLSCAAACCLSLPALAEPTNAELDQRLRAVEGNIAAILELLQSQQAGGSADVAMPNETEEASVAVGEVYRWGALNLDIYTKPVTSAELDELEEDSTRLMTDGPGVASESIIVQPAEKFRWGAVLDQDETKRFVDSDGLLFVEWSGYLQIDKRGEHAFSVTLSSLAGQFYPKACRSVMRLEGQEIVDAHALTPGLGRSTLDGFTNEPFSVERISTQQLEPGAYAFELSLTCIGHRQRAMENTEVMLRMLEPGDRAPKPIPSERFGIRI